MASIVTIFSILATLTLLFVLFNPTLARNHNNRDNLSLKKLCSKTDDKNLCMSLMSSNSQYTQSLDYESDYMSLTEVVIDLAYSKAEDIQQDIKYVIDHTRNDHKKELYKSCSRNYHDVLKDLQKTKDLLRDGDYKRIEVQIKYVIEEVRSCKDQVKGNENTDSSNLEKKNKEFAILCDIVRVSAKYWKGDDWKVNKKN